MPRLQPQTGRHDSPTPSYDRDVRSILGANYLHRDPALAENAIRKLETGRPSPR
jgi:hypothetical protein